jgi:TP901 family phage tail tape measure protein
MALVAKIDILVVAKTGGLDAGLNKGKKSVRGFRSAVDGATRQLKMFALQAVGVYAVARAMKSAAMASENMNRAMARSTSIMRGLTQAQRGMLRGKAYETAYGRAFSPSEVAQGYYYLTSAGMTVEQSLAAVGQVADFAQAGMFDLARATDLVTDAQSALGMRVPDATRNLQNLTHVTDTLIEASILANATAEQFSEALTTKAGPAARMLGKPIEETMAVLAAFADQGIKGSEAGTQLGIVWRDLQTKAIKNASVWDEMNLKVFDAAGNMRHTADILADLEQKLGGMGDQQQRTTLLMLGFSDKSVAATQALMGYSDEIRNWQDEMENMKDTAKKTAEAVMTEWDRAMSKLGASWAKLRDDTLGPMAKNFALGLEGIIDPMGQVNKTFSKDPLQRRLEQLLWAQQQIQRSSPDIYLDPGLRTRKLKTAEIEIAKVRAQIMERANAKPFSRGMGALIAPMVEQAMKQAGQFQRRRGAQERIRDILGGAGSRLSRLASGISAGFQFGGPLAQAAIMSRLFQGAQPQARTFELPRAGAVLRGTAEGFSASLEKEQLNVERQQVGELRKQSATLNRIEDKLPEFRPSGSGSVAGLEN